MKGNDVGDQKRRENTREDAVEVVRKSVAFVMFFLAEDSNIRSFYFGTEDSLDDIRNSVLSACINSMMKNSPKDFKQQLLADLESVENQEESGGGDAPHH